MQKKFISLLLAALLLTSVGVTTVSADTSVVNQNGYTINMKNDPGGFPELYWGQTLDVVKSLYQVKYLGNVKESEQYAVSIPEAKGNFFLHGPVLVFAVFFDGKLGAIRVPVMGGYSYIIQPLITMYGQPKQKDKLYIWHGPKSIMILAPTNLKKNDGMIYLVSNELKNNK